MPPCLGQHAVCSPNLAASLHPQCPQYHHQLGSILNTAFSAQDLWLQPSPSCHHLPLPTKLTAALATPALPQSLHHHHAQWRETDPWCTENQPPPSFPVWGCSGVVPKSSPDRMCSAAAGSARQQALLSQLPVGSKQLTVREELCFRRVQVEVTSTGVLGVGAVGHHRP